MFSKVELFHKRIKFPKIVYASYLVHVLITCTEYPVHFQQNFNKHFFVDSIHFKKRQDFPNHLFKRRINKSLLVQILKEKSKNP